MPCLSNNGSTGTKPDRTNNGILGGTLRREEPHDHTENQTRGPRAYRGVVRRGPPGPDGPGMGGFDEGVAAYLSGDYATAIRELRPLAERG